MIAALGGTWWTSVDREGIEPPTRGFSVPLSVGRKALININLWLSFGGIFY